MPDTPSPPKSELDLLKYELRIREAVDKVLNRALAMHNTSELQDVINTVGDQLKSLEMDITGGVFISINAEVEEHFYVWGSGATAEYTQKVLVPILDRPIYHNLVNHIKNGSGLLTEYYPNEEKVLFFKELFKHPPYNQTGKMHQEEVLSRVGGYARSCYTSQHTSIFIINHHGRKFSDRDHEVLMRFADIFEKSYRRFLDLQKAEQQAREAQIEAALERVRTRTMAMHDSSELREVVAVLYQQVAILGLADWGSNIEILDESMNRIEVFLSDNNYRVFDQSFFFHGEDHAEIKKQWDNWRNGVKHSSILLQGDEKRDYDDYLFTQTDFRLLPDEVKKGIRSLDHAAFSFARMAYGFLVAINNTSVLDAEGFRVLGRFASVFEQAYTRFLDLQKAEAQAREAQIEAALERTRTQSMLMQQSHELDATARVFHQQLLSLGIESEFSYVWLPDVENEKHMFWATFDAADQSGHSLKSKSVTYDLDRTEPYTAACFAAWESDEPVHVIPIPPEEVAPFFDTWSELLKGAEKLKAENFPEGLYYAESYMKYGCFGINIRRKLTEAEQQILKRFTVEFERTYTRFLDLQKAEAQAREAKIEASLERIRARAMAMQSSEELQDVLSLLFQQYDVLGIHPVNVFLTLFDLDHDRFIYRASGKSGMRAIGQQVIDLSATDIWDNVVEKFKNEKSDLAEMIHYPKETLPAIFDIFHEAFTAVPDAYQIRPEDFPEGIYTTHGHFEHGYLGINHVRPATEEENDIIARFSNEFGRVYRRFLDLQKAEAQAREAKVEAALERVRARTMAMQKSSELSETAAAMFKQIEQLGLHPWSCGFNIWDHQQNRISQWVSSGDGRILPPFETPSNEDLFVRISKAAKRGESLYIEAMGGEALKAHYAFMRSLPGLEEIISTMDAAGIALPTFQVNHVAFFSHGYLMFITYEPAPEFHEIFKRFAKVFEQTYTRFLDLKQAEEQELLIRQERDRLEKTLNELRATQAQLIHSEKMASLGELTAGIAHEIKNPLNFVNNFSEVSEELLEDMVSELNQGNNEEAIEIIEDVKTNLRRIVEHGKRADSIVKGMLMHSRSDSKVREETDINALCDEYLRLAYHGLRARDKSFNSEMNTIFDENLPQIEVAPQEIGRVLLNLITNAFHAVGEKQIRPGSADFHPLVVVKTSMSNEMVRIEVVDNGDGIPENIMGKIFQPFFTTKPTGSGTGLGLSISYDIVKTHGGTLEASSEEGKGTRFILQLPMK